MKDDFTLSLGSSNVTVFANDGTLRVHGPSDDCTLAQNVAFARTIVRAVNSYEALLTALKGMVALWDRVHPGNPPLGMLTVNSARAAIALAESHDA